MGGCRGLPVREDDGSVQGEVGVIALIGVASEGDGGGCRMPAISVGLHVVLGDCERVVVSVVGEELEVRIGGGVIILFFVGTH